VTIDFEVGFEKFRLLLVDFPVHQSPLARVLGRLLRDSNSVLIEN
jgi:hypothetical protein